jgi:cell shape-determining protein MreC
MVLVVPYQKVRNFGEDVTRVRGENALLSARVEVLEARLTAVSRAAADSARGHGLPVLDPGFTGPLAPCEVIGRTRARYADMMQITSAEFLGWRRGLAVVDAGGYLGRLHTVTDSHTAWVELLTSPDMALGVELERTGLLGVLRPRAGSFVLEMVGRDEDVVAGDRVITSGIAEVRDFVAGVARDPVPRGLPVGDVYAVSVPSDDIFKRIEVRPLADFRRNSIVFVVGVGSIRIEPRLVVPDSTTDAAPAPAVDTTLGAM